MRENVIKIPANQEEITLYCYMGEALLKIQMVEQALSHSVTLKMNPDNTKEQADEFLKQHQTYTLGRAINVAIKEKLYSKSLQDGLNDFLEKRNWLVHNVMIDIQNGLYSKNQKEELCNKIKAISDKAESIQHEIEYDMIDFCTSRGKDMSKNIALLKLQEKGIRIKM